MATKAAPKFTADQHVTVHTNRDSYDGVVEKVTRVTVYVRYNNRSAGFDIATGEVKNGYNLWVRTDEEEAELQRRSSVRARLVEHGLSIMSGAKVNYDDLEAAVLLLDRLAAERA